jgi:hypothetical protein
MSGQRAHRISDDLRYELADAARTAEAANKPRVLLVLATLLFVIAGLSLVVTLRQFESAKQSYRAQQGYKARVADLQLQFERAEELQDSGQAATWEKIPDLYSRIENAASTVGLLNKPPIPRPTATPVQGAIRNFYPYKMQDPSLQNLLSWVEEARRAVPGLEVSSVEILPAPKHWNFNVTFVRWERSS